jgi:hypothetical protein
MFDNISFVGLLFALPHSPICQTKHRITEINVEVV